MHSTAHAGNLLDEERVMQKTEHTHTHRERERERERESSGPRTTTSSTGDDPESPVRAVSILTFVIRTGAT
jgi:hypothetical protein